MKLLVFSLLLCGAWAQTQDSADPPQDNANVGEVGEDSADPPQDSVNGTEVGESANEAFGDDVEKATGIWQPFSGRQFMFQSGSVSWAHAQQRCMALGGNLATIHDYREEDFVKRIAKGRASWIGLSDAQREGFWFWINGDPLRYTNWCRREPNNNMNQDCVTINYSGKKCWDDLWCSRSRPFVCERK